MIEMTDFTKTPFFALTFPSFF